jgi:hypothetical protein
VTLYFKTMPWFVSDATKDDLVWIFDQLKNPAASSLWQTTCKRWQEHIRNGQWIIQTHRFFTLSYDFAEMRRLAPELYCTMSQSHLIIFKGDLNYRKLVGDLQWPINERFQTALRGFLPTSLVVLRTCKSDVQLELDLKSARQVAHQDPKWMTNGKWGVIQAVFKPSTDQDRM